MRRVLFFLFCIVQFSYAQKDSYTNPILHADYSDPDVCRVGEDYYMVASSFNAVPGLPLLHSRDLVHWELIGHALPRLVPEDHYRTPRPGQGVWAPSIRFHKGEFYIYYPDPDFGIYLTKSSSIHGPWSTPVLVEAGKGLIDPCPLWDEDGSVYLVHAFAGSRAGIKSVLMLKKMNAEGTKTLDSGVIVYDGQGLDPTVEGPKMYKRNGYYYILAPAGGVKTGWQLALRAKTPYGPYERKVVLEQGNTPINGPHQGAWVQSAEGEDWFIHFQDKGLYGRIVHLQPVQWVNDWPLMGVAEGDKRVPVLRYRLPKKGKSAPPSPTVPGLSKAWQWQANPQPTWALPKADGSFRLYALESTAESFAELPQVLSQKFGAPAFTVELRLDMRLREGEEAGMLVLGRAYGGMYFRRAGENLRVFTVENGGGGEKIREMATVPYSPHVRWTLIVKDGGECIFSADRELFRFQAREGVWIGAKWGIFAKRSTFTNDSGYLDVLECRVE
jgi:beta-xylosidase